MSTTVTSEREKSAQERDNLRIVLEFYEQIINQQRWDQVDRYVDADYIQHKPEVADGPAGLLEFMRRVYAQSPHHRVRIVRALVDGDFVMLHVNVINAVEAPSLAVMDVFRLRDGKLVEHWDVAQTVPETGYRNRNTMF